MANRSVILTTHLLDEAEALCSRIGIMSHGAMRCLGSSQHLRTKFGSVFEVTISLDATRIAREDLLYAFEALDEAIQALFRPPEMTAEMRAAEAAAVMMEDGAAEEEVKGETEMADVGVKEVHGAPGEEAARQDAQQAKLEEKEEEKVTMEQGDIQVGSENKEQEQQEYQGTVEQGAEPAGAEEEQQEQEEARSKQQDLAEVEGLSEAVVPRSINGQASSPDDLSDSIVVDSGGAPATSFEDNFPDDHGEKQSAGQGIKKANHDEGISSKHLDPLETLARRKVALFRRPRILVGGHCKYHPSECIAEKGRLFGWKDVGLICSKCESEEADAVAREKEVIREAMESADAANAEKEKFRVATLVNRHSYMLTYQVPARLMNVARAFSTIENRKDELFISNYTISQPTLEQVFLSFEDAPTSSLKASAIEASIESAFDEKALRDAIARQPKCCGMRRKTLKRLNRWSCYFCCFAPSLLMYEGWLFFVLAKLYGYTDFPLSPLNEYSRDAVCESDLDMQLNQSHYFKPFYAPSVSTDSTGKTHMVTLSRTVKFEPKTRHETYCGAMAVTFDWNEHWDVQTLNLSIGVSGDFDGTKVGTERTIPHNVFNEKVDLVNNANVFNENFRVHVLDDDDATNVRNPYFDGKMYGNYPFWDQKTKLDDYYDRIGFTHRPWVVSTKRYIQGEHWTFPYSGLYWQDDHYDIWRTGRLIDMDSAKLHMFNDYGNTLSLQFLGECKPHDPGPVKYGTFEKGLIYDGNEPDAQDEGEVWWGTSTDKNMRSEKSLKTRYKLWVGMEDIGGGTWKHNTCPTPNYQPLREGECEAGCELRYAAIQGMDGDPITSDDEYEDFITCPGIRSCDTEEEVQPSRRMDGEGFTSMKDCWEAGEKDIGRGIEACRLSLSNQCFCTLACRCINDNRIMDTQSTAASTLSSSSSHTPLILQKSASIGTTSFKKRAEPPAQCSASTESIRPSSTFRTYSTPGEVVCYPGRDYEVDTHSAKRLSTYSSTKWVRTDGDAGNLCACQAAPTLGSGACAKGWHSFDGNCYFLDREKTAEGGYYWKTYTECRDYCAIKNGTMPCITSDAQNSFLSGLRPFVGESQVEGVWNEHLQGRCTKDCLEKGHASFETCAEGVRLFDGATRQFYDGRSGSSMSNITFMLEPGRGASIHSCVSGLQAQLILTIEYKCNVTGSNTTGGNSTVDCGTAAMEPLERDVFANVSQGYCIGEKRYYRAGAMQMMGPMFRVMAIPYALSIILFWVTCTGLIMTKAKDDTYRERKRATKGKYCFGSCG